LTSATSYYEAKTNSRVDASGIYNDFFASFYFYYPRISTLSDYDSNDEAFVQEFRLTSNGDGRVDWIVGAFYQDQEMKFDTVQTMPGFEEWFEAAGLAAYFGTPSPLTTPANLVYVQDRTTGFNEAALFGEMTFHVTDAWDVTLGGRFFRQEIDNDDTSILPTCFTILESIGLGFYCGSPPLGGSSNRSKDSLDDQIFKFNTAYAFSDHTRAYFTWSQGFRNGGVNALPTVGFIDDSVGGQFPDVNSFSADKVDNWEVGLKGTLGERNSLYTIAVFNMEWKHPQARIFGAASGIEGVGNSTADARSQGIELEISGILGERWDYALGYSYTDAKFIEDGELYVNPVQAGDPLPGHSRNMASGSLTYTVPLSDDNRLQFNVSGFYRSGFENDLPGGLQEFQLDSYSLWDASIAYDAGNWILRLFGKNLTDEDAVASASLLGPSSERLVVTRPRTIGLSFTYRYE
jgi:outer membrane receptor protein involved in Fe transport